MIDDQPALVDQYDIDERDELHDLVFEFGLELHKAGFTRRDISAALREHANEIDDHFADGPHYDKAPVDKNPVLPGDSE